MDIKTIIQLKKNIKCIKLAIKESNNESNNESNKESYKEWKNEDISSSFDIDKIAHKYSNTKIPLYRFFYNKEIITRNNNYIVTYQCLHCDVIHTVALNNILRKINKNITKCRICKELDEEKRKKQSEYMLNNNPIIRSKNSNISLSQDLPENLHKKTLSLVLFKSFMLYGSTPVEYIHHISEAYWMQFSHHLHFQQNSLIHSYPLVILLPISQFLLIQVQEHYQ